MALQKPIPTQANRHGTRACRSRCESGTVWTKQGPTQGEVATNQGMGMSLAMRKRYGVDQINPPGRRLEIRTPEPVEAAVRVYKLNLPSFFQGLEQAFDIKPAPKQGETLGAAEVIHGLKQVWAKLGVEDKSAKPVFFFSDRTSELIVRAPHADLDLLEAALRTLGPEAIERAKTDAATDR